MHPFLEDFASKFGSFSEKVLAAQSYFKVIIITIFPFLIVGYLGVALIKGQYLFKINSKQLRYFLNHMV